MEDKPPPPPQPKPIARFELTQQKDNHWTQEYAYVKCLEASGKIPKRLVRKVRKRQQAGG